MPNSQYVCVHTNSSSSTTLLYKVKHILGRWSLDQIWTWNDRTESQWLRHSLILGYCSTILETLSTICLLTTTNTELKWTSIWWHMIKATFWDELICTSTLLLSLSVRWKNLEDFLHADQTIIYVLMALVMYYKLGQFIFTCQRKMRWGVMTRIIDDTGRSAASCPFLILALFTAEWFISLNFKNIDFTRHISKLP